LKNLCNFGLNLKIFNMVFYLLITILIAYEIQCIIQNKVYYRTLEIYSKYKDQIKVKWKKHTPSKFMINTLKHAFFQLFYFICLIIGLFTYNYIFFAGVIVLMLLHELSKRIFKKSFKIRNFLFSIDSVLSIILLTLAVINYMYYQLDSIAFINFLIGKI